MARARSSPQTESPLTESPRTDALTDEQRWRLSDGVLFSVFSSLLLWSLIVAGLHATLT